MNVLTKTQKAFIYIKRCYNKKVKRTGGIKNRLKRDKSRIDYHISETALDDYKEWDLVIDNNSTKEDLFNTLKKIVQKYPLK